MKLWSILSKLKPDSHRRDLVKYKGLFPRRDKLTKKECIELKMRIFNRLVMMQKENGKRFVVRHKLTLKCDRIRVRDHRMPNGYRCYNHYYYQ